MACRISAWAVIGLLALLGGCGLTPEKQQMLENLRASAETAKIRVEDKLRDNPHSAARDSLAALDTILAYTENVKADPARFSPEKLQEYLQKIEIINENLDRFSDLTLQADVSFPLGKYRLEDLSAYALRENDKLVENIAASVVELEQKYPAQKVSIALKISGYTDETPFTAGTALEKEIVRALGAAAPAQPAAKRAAYNQVLSRLRAESLGEYLRGKLQQELAGRLSGIEVKIFGEGETLPEKSVTPPYQATDPRRRICIISPFIGIIP